MFNFGSLAAEIGSLVLGTPADFNGFRVLALSLHRRCSTEVNKTFMMFGRLVGSYIIMVTRWNRADHYIFMLWFLSSSFFPRLISAAAHWMSTILPRMVWP